MGRRSIRTRREWLAFCGGTTAGLTALAGCTGSSDDDDNDDTDSTGSNGEEGNGDETTENGTEEEGNTSSVGGSWPMSNFSANNGMVTDEWSGPDGPLEEGWTVEMEYANVSAPVVGNGFVYVADRESRLHAIDLATGDVEWTYEPELPPGTPPNPQWGPTTPAVTEDAVYFLTETLYALDPEEGDVLWSVELGSLYSGHIRVYDGVVYVHNDGKLYAIDTDEQAITWEGQANSTQDIAIGEDGMLYAVRRTNNDNDYEVMGIDISSEGAEWTYSPAGNVASGFGLLVHDGTVYLHQMGELLMIDGETGDAETVTEFEQTNELVPTGGQPPTIADGIAYSPGLSRYPAVHAVELDTGKEPDTWNSNALENGPTGLQPFVTDDTLYVWRDSGYVQLDALDPETGERHWSVYTVDHIEIYGAMIEGYAILENTVVFTANGNTSVIGTLESG